MMCPQMPCSKMPSRWRIALIAPLVCASCTVGTRYQRPTAAAPTALKEIAGNDQWKMATPSDALLKGKWWEIFGDPELNQLEESVNINNQNIKQAEANYRQARATVASNHANYYPTIGATPAGTQTYEGRNVSKEGAITINSYSLPLTASWEPDLWGRVRLSVENAVESAQVSAADLENTRLSQQALLATDYFSLAGEDMQLAILRDTTDAYQKNLTLTINRYNGGVASKSDITLAQTQLDAAEAQYTGTRIQRAQYEHAIAMLTGQAPSAIEIPTSKINGPPPPIPISVPSQLLERRPDIAASERQVAAANASVGLAQAAYYPTLTLSANFGVLSSNLANLFTFASRYWSGGPSLSQTLFDFGRRGAALENARAAYDGTVANYRQTVLAAFQEVEDDLASLRYLAEEEGQQKEAVAANTLALSLELDRYKAGTDSYLNVVTVQTTLLSNQQTYVNVMEQRMTAAVDLVKAVGGGWNASDIPSADALRATAQASPKSTQKVAQAAGR
jgi:NodT family efflux transporter outer membrane factor (OMF) lipoprotein